MNRNATIHRWFTAALACFAMLTGMISTGCKDDPVSTPSDVVDGVYKTDSKPFGKSYAEWTAIWWQWVFQQPATDSAGKVIHPLLDSTGANCHNGQSASSSVFFLGGWLGSGTYARTCTIPSGKAIFFPVYNYFYDTTGNWTLDSMRYYRDTLANPITTAIVSAEVDGKGVANLKNYPFKSVPFTATLTNGNLYQYWGNPIPAGNVMPYISDGYWLMLAPLAAGAHTIHFKAGDGTNVFQEVTYNLTVQ